MPSYALPPWIQAADPAAQFVTGIRTGASIGEAQARLAQEQEEARMRAQARQEQLAADMLQAKTRLDYENAYHQQNIALQKQRLEDLQRVNAAKTDEAASKWAAQQGYSTSYQNAIAQGKTAEQAHMQAVLENPRLISPQMLPKSLHSPAKWVPENPATGAPAHFETDTGQVHIPSQALTGENKIEDDKLKAQISQLYKAINSRDYLPEEKASFKKDIEDLVEKRKAFYRQLMPMPKSATEQYEPGMLNSLPPVLPSTAVAPAAAQIGAPIEKQPKALPDKKGDLVKGEVYMTRRGPARWDGEKFVKE